MSCSSCDGGFVPAPPKIANGISYPMFDPCPKCAAENSKRTTQPVFRAPRIEKPRDRTHKKNEDLLAKATEWIKSHQRATERILQYAKAIAGIGMKFRVKHLVERVRDDGFKEGWDPEEYKINNSHTAYIARWLVAQDQSLQGSMEMREVKWV